MYRIALVGVMVSMFGSLCPHVQHSPQAFATNRSVGFSLGMMRTLFAIEQLNVERCINKARASLQKTRELVAAEQAQKQSSDQQDQGHPIDERVAQQVKRLQALTGLHKSTQSMSGTFGAIEETIGVRNNITERALGGLGRLMPIGAMPRHRLGKNIGLRALLVLLDGMLGMVRHVKYKNVKELMWITAVQRVAHLAYLVLTHGYKKVHPRTLGSYVLQLLNVGASFFGSPRENKLPNFTWLGQVRNFDVGKAVEDYKGYMHEQIVDPTISRDRRAAIIENMRPIIRDGAKHQFKKDIYRKKVIPLFAIPEDKIDDAIANIVGYASELDSDHRRAISFNLKAEQIKGYAPPKPDKPIVPAKGVSPESFAQSIRSESRDDNCLICLESMQDTEKLAYLSCKHLFCRECITESLQHNKACPACRKEPTKLVYVAVQEKLTKPTVLQSLKRLSLLSDTKNAPSHTDNIDVLNYQPSQSDQKEAIEEIRAAIG